MGYSALAWWWYKGKLNEYAAIVGKAPSSLAEHRKAAEVAHYYSEEIRTSEFDDFLKIRTSEFTLCECAAV